MWSCPLLIIRFLTAAAYEMRIAEDFKNIKIVDLECKMDDLPTEIAVKVTNTPNSQTQRNFIFKKQNPHPMCSI